MFAQATALTIMKDDELLEKSIKDQLRTYPQNYPEELSNWKGRSSGRHLAALYNGLAKIERRRGNMEKHDYYKNLGKESLENLNNTYFDLNTQSILEEVVVLAN
jgi:hypothetical protein